MDYIDITLDTGVTRRMEVVSTFNSKHYKFNYIIYCEIDKSHYYLAKYIEEFPLEYTHLGQLSPYYIDAINRGLHVAYN